MKLAVVGNPVGHSLSPLIGTELAHALGFSVNYAKLELNLDNFQEEVTSFFASQGTALNFTKPFKAKAFSLASDLGANLYCADIANLIINRGNGVLDAYATDAMSFLQDVAHNFAISNFGNLTTLIIGNGDVALQLSRELMRQNGNVAILARNNARNYGNCDFDPSICYDLVVNTTPNSQDNKLFDYLSARNLSSCLYDLNYTESKFGLKSKAQQYGLRSKYSNGLGMLIYVILNNYKYILQDKYNLNSINEKNFYNHIVRMVTNVI